MLAGFAAPGRQPADSIGDGPDVRGRSAATASDDIELSLLRQSADYARHGFRSVVITSKLVWNAGIGIEAHGMVAETGNLSDQRSHHVGAQGAVDTEGAQCRSVLYRAIECLECLPCKRTAAPVRDRCGNDYRQGIAKLFHRIHGGLGIKRIKASLKYDEVRASAH